MDHSHDALCVHCLILYSHQRCTTRIYKANKGYQIRGPPLTFPISLMYRMAHGLLTQSALRGDILDFSLSPPLAHLLFVDDSLLFFRSNAKECQKNLEVLQACEMILGQQINKAKNYHFL